MSHNYYNQIKNYENENHKTKSSNKKGVVYTPIKLAREMIRTFDPKPHEKTADLTVGTGVFAIELLEHMKNKYNLSSGEMKDYLKNNFYMYDVDFEAIMSAEITIRKYLEANYDLFYTELNIHLKNSLLDWRQHYHNVICNPPYIRRKNIETYDLEILKRHYSTCENGNFDMYYAFMELAEKISDRSCFITPNSYLVNDSASTLRNKIMKSISYIRDFGTEKKFKLADIYTAITLLDKNAGDTFEYLEGDEPSKTMSRSRLYADKWYLGAPVNNMNYNPGATKFSDVVDIYSPIQTGADSLFVVDTKDSVNGYYFTKHEEIMYAIEEKACLTLKKLSKYFGVTKAEDKAVIYPYGRDGVILYEKDFIDKFPQAYRYLLAVKDELVQRDKGQQQKYGEWYAYARRQGINMDFTNKECTLVPVVYKQDSFMSETILPKERFLHLAGYVIVAKPGHEKLVQQILIDPNFEKYLDTYSKKMTGNYNRISSTLLKNYSFVASVRG